MQAKITERWHMFGGAFLLSSTWEQLWPDDLEVIRDTHTGDWGFKPRFVGWKSPYLIVPWYPRDYEVWSWYKEIKF